jgi:hypothetical protein
MYLSTQYNTLAITSAATSPYLVRTHARTNTKFTNKKKTLRPKARVKILSICLK